MARESGRGEDRGRQREEKNGRFDNVAVCTRLCVFRVSMTVRVHGEESNEEAYIRVYV